MAELKIVAMSESHIPSIKKLADQAFGSQYYVESELSLMLRRSFLKGQSPSLVLVDGSQVVGARISFPPGCWQEGKGQGLSEDRWPHSKNETAYFQSLFIDSRLQGKGWGKKLSLASIDILRTMLARGVVCHSWVESPGNASRRYLESLGFSTIATHQGYWSDVDYSCERCESTCQCSAEEMYLDLEVSP